MNTLIWILTWLPLAYAALLKLPVPVNISLTLSNFSYILKWERGPGTPAEAYYNVTAATTRATSLVPVDGCERVLQPLVCNMTKVFKDLRDEYIIQVKAHLKAQTSEPDFFQYFTPLDFLALPLLEVRLCNRNICVDLRSPAEHLREIYGTFAYRLQIKCEDKTFQKDTESLNTVIVEDLLPGRQYCVSVCFGDSLYRKTSNKKCSQPVCVVTPAVYAPDPFISAGLCMLVVAAVIVIVMLACSGFICLKRRPLPYFLTSIPHIEQAVAVIVSSSSLLNVKLMVPSADDKRISHSSSDESDEENTTEDAQGSTGGGNYKGRLGTNLLSSSSSSLSVLACLPSKPESQPSVSANEQSAFFNPLPKAKVSADIHASAGLSQTMSIDTNGLTGGGIKEEKEGEELEEEGDCQDVNILTLTFGRLEEEGELHLDMPEVESLCAKEECETSPVLPSQTWDTKEFTTESVPWCADVEEEEEEVEEEKEEEEEEEEKILEHNGYMGRPRTNI